MGSLIWRMRIFWLWWVSRGPWFSRQMDLEIKNITQGNCSDTKESITHVLWDCLIAKNFWGRSSYPFSLKQSFFGDLVTWIQTNAKSSTQASGKDYDWSSFFLFGVWNLWIQRNWKAFKQQAPNPNLVKVVEMQAQEFLYCVVEPSIEKARHVKQVRWLKPTEG